MAGFLESYRLRSQAASAPARERVAGKGTAAALPCQTPGLATTALLGDSLGRGCRNRARASTGRPFGRGRRDELGVGLHPALGEVTLQQLIATWTVHDLGHLAQISRTLAKQYKEQVGPWQAYLSVLHR